MAELIIDRRYPAAPTPADTEENIIARVMDEVRERPASQPAQTAVATGARPERARWNTD